MRFYNNGTVVDCPIVPREETQEDFSREICTWVEDAIQPFSVMDNERFKKMIQLSNRDLKIASRQTIPRKIFGMEETNKIRIKDLLGKALGRVSLTADEWKFRIFRGYKEITVH